MNEAVEWLFRLAGIALGCSILHFAFFLYEDEEGRVKHRLEDIWIRVNDRSDVGTLAVSRLIRETSALSAEALSRIFGEYTISTQSVFASFCFGCASFAFYGAMLTSIDGGQYGWMCWLGALLVFFGVLPGLIQARFLAKIVKVMVVLLGFVLAGHVLMLAVAFFYFDLDYLPEYVALGVSVLFVSALAIVTDIIWISLVRRTLKSMSERLSFARLLMFLGTNLVAIAVGLLPLVISYKKLGADFVSMVEKVALAVFASRLFVVSTATVFLLVLFIVLLHRLIWPVLDRMVYAVHRHEIFQNRKTLGTFATALIGTSAWDSGVIKWFGTALGFK